MKIIGKILLWTVGCIAGLIILIILVSFIFYPPQYVYRVLVWQESDVYDYLNHFPGRSLDASPIPFYFDRESDDKSITGILETILDIDDIEAFFERSDTQAFVIIQDDVILYENYFNGASRDSLVTSFSVAKSFTSALVGIAIAEGHIYSVNDAITDYLPELLERDLRFSNITIRHLLLMASGLDYESDRTWILNGDDPLTTYYPDQRKAAIKFTNIIDAPGEYFQYNKYHPQLLGMILERTTGTAVTNYLQDKVWDPIGMEFGGSWSIDSEGSGFEKMETGINARAIDFAKLGRLYLENGNWNSTKVVPSEWVAESTQIDRSTHRASYYSGMQDFYDSGGYYKYMWWGFSRDDNGYDFSAEGDRGQMIYVSPQKKLIIVRNGFTYGDVNWWELAMDLASEITMP
jgi:CubicO group peptidase (beta-lactamase class C family)